MPERSAGRWGWVGVVGAVLLLLGVPSTPHAHEIPSDVTVLAFVKPEGDRLRVLVRVPLVSMRDVEFPLYGPGYLDIRGAEPLLEDQALIWIADYLELWEDGSPLQRPEVAGVRLSLPSDRSFTSYEQALAHLQAGTLDPDTEIVLEQVLMDVLLEAPVRSASARFSLEPTLAHLGIRTTTVLRFLPPGGSERVLQYSGNPGRVELDPRWHQAAFLFVKMGFLHILEGLDHILFLLCLVIPFRRFVPLVPIVTAFTLAHSVTLMAAAFGMAPNVLWFPPFIETLIALSIVYMAFENIAGASLRRRWMVAFAFGLIHGFGFSFLLTESLQFAGSHLATSLLAFNVGVELGQLFFLVLAIPVLELLFRKVVAERVGMILLSALVAHTAWHWMTERGGEFLQYDLSLPQPDALFLAALMRWTMLLLVAGGLMWGLSGAVEWWTGRRAVAGGEAEVTAGD